ncbi:DUF6528 family protein [Streptomyces sp. NRRL F-5630]|uniref:DUF6528 family protein n=1 Tax=unclassified Streptomyces TaxID=2593676 RepID=UPI00068E29A3|nr:DUF6528 family protein [Streptomyces sp. NRRL F-5630]
MTRAEGNRGVGRRALLVGALGAIGAGAAVSLPFTRKSFAATPPGLLVGDQKARAVLLLDSAKTAWNPDTDSTVAAWRFAPDTDSRYADLNPAKSFTYVTEAKPVKVEGTSCVLVTASYGFAAVVEYPSGDRRWGGVVSSDPGGGDDLNAHSIELLPSGNVAVACTSGGLVRLYAASQSPTSTAFTSVVLAGAHGVQWDPASGLLWAVGDHELVGYRPTGSAGQEKLLREKTFSLDSLNELSGTPQGHDLYAVSGQPDLLWVTTRTGVYQFSIGRGQFAPYPGTSWCSAQQDGVKSISNVGTSIAMTAPDGNLAKAWWSRRVHVEDGPGQVTHVLGGEGYGGVYKARWWQPQVR